MVDVGFFDELCDVEVVVVYCFVVFEIVEVGFGCGCFDVEGD